MTTTLFWITFALLGLAALCHATACWIDWRRERAARRAERAALKRMFRDPSRHCRFKP
jgi:hypothetical protein